ncbi:UDP-4-amino-4-deoxy-L-arabinose--oxoglutarate aminotransferase [subsurface metagenome]
MIQIIPFSVPFIEEEEKKEILDTLKSGWITTGPKVKQFEKDFAEYIGCKHTIAINSCTAALHLALDNVELKEGDEIIIPTMTFVATGEVVTYFKAKPVLVDCEEDTLLIDVNNIEEKINKKTKAIIPVHYAGQSCAMDDILQIAKKYNLKVIEDAAHSLPTRYRDKMIGTLGDITCFSFYATKTITTGEGGMACTENEKFAKRMKIMSLHGISKDAWKRYTAEGSWYYEVIEAGYKYNMTDIAAALGIAQLKKCSEFYRKRSEIANKYMQAFKEFSEIKIPVVRDYGIHAWHLYVIQLNLKMLKINRAQFIEKMKDNGIGCSVHFIPLHLHPYYKNTFAFKPKDFPVASYVYERIVSLPIYPKMIDEDVDYVIDNVIKIIKENKK